MKEFIKRYLFLIFLSFLVVVLIFLKIIYGNNDKKNIIMDIEITPTPTMIFPDPKKITFEELEKMDNETYEKYINHLTEEELKNLPDREPSWDDELLPTIPYIELQ